MTDRKYEALKLENQLCFPLYACSKEVIRRYRPYLDPLDITYTQYIVLMVVWDRDEISVKDLGTCLYLDSGTLTPVLKKLEQKGYITRERSCVDERNVIIRPTVEGMALRDRAKDIPKHLGACVRLEPEEAVQLHNLLYKLLSGLEQ